MEFANPALDLRVPATFGVLSSQGDTPRAIQIGFRVDFEPACGRQACLPQASRG